MKKMLIAIAVIIPLIFLVFLFTKNLYNTDKQVSKNAEKPKPTLSNKLNMQITSSAFQNNQEIPSKYTCNGDNINPTLKFSDVPDSTKSLVLILDDPDAPMGTWVHWVVYNIDPKTKEIPENSVPDKADQGTTSFGKPGYGGPCPPSGTHHYHFKLYALDTSLGNLNNANKTAVEKGIQGHIIEQSELIGLYSKK